MKCPETLKLTTLGATGTQLEVAPETSMKEIPEEQIIYIDDDAEPTPLQLLEKQVDSLLMPPQWTQLQWHKRPTGHWDEESNSSR